MESGLTSGPAAYTETWEVACLGGVFSFHYDRDNWRVQQVINMGTLEGQPLLRPQAWEEAKRKAGGIQNWIDQQMRYKTALVVLIGAQSASRPWVKYEIEKAWIDKKRLVGVRIHGLEDASGKTDFRGANPFEKVSLTNGTVVLSWSSPGASVEEGPVMKVGRRAAAAVVVCVAVLTASYGAVSAVYSYQGEDYSYDYNSRVYLRNCDQEADSTSTKGIYDFNSSGDSNGNVSDQDGANGVCASKNTGGTIARHRTCENPNWWPDTCGNWQATS